MVNGKRPVEMSLSKPVKILLKKDYLSKYLNENKMSIFIERFISLSLALICS